MVCMKKKIEKNFQTEWTRSIKKFFPRGHYYKIPDPSAKTRKDGRKVVRASKRPYDNYILVNGKFYAFELKIVNKCESFRFSIFADHQIKNLKEVYNNGGNGFMVVNYRFVPTRAQANKYSLPVQNYNFCFLMDIKYLELVKEELGTNYIPINFLMNLYADKSASGVVRVLHRQGYNTDIWLVNEIISNTI